MKALQTRVAILALGLVLPLFAATSPATAQADTEYKVTITNVTKNQIISPPLVVSHASTIQRTR